MSKILISVLAAHQVAAVMRGEGVLQDGHVLTRADVETTEERNARVEAEKAQAQAAAEVVESGLAAAVADGRLITSEDRDAMKAEVRDELLADEDFLAKVEKLLAKRAKATAPTGTPKPAETNDAPAPETVEQLVRRNREELVAIAVAETVAHESDANKQGIAEAIVRAREAKAAQGS